MFKRHDEILGDLYYTSDESNSQCVISTFHIIHAHIPCVRKLVNYSVWNRSYILIFYKLTVNIRFSYPAYISYERAILVGAVVDFLFFTPKPACIFYIIVDIGIVTQDNTRAVIHQKFAVLILRPYGELLHRFGVGIPLGTASDVSTV